MLFDLRVLDEVYDNSLQIAAFVFLLTSLLVITVIIWRLGWFEEESSDVPQQAPMTAIEKVHNPFILNLIDAPEASLENGARVRMTSQVPCCIRVYWGIFIHDVYALIHQPWPAHLSSLQDDSFRQFALHSEETIEVDPVSEKTFVFKPPSAEFITDLGEPPRDRYPLVIVVCDLCVLEGSVDESIYNQVICCVTMFHVKDTVCPGESQIVAQYVRTARGRPCNLKQLYVTTGEGSSDTTPSDPSGSAPEQSAQCVICLSASVDRALLPCRHACVCDTCFTRLTQCPMCRNVISSSFHIDSASSSS